MIDSIAATIALAVTGVGLVVCVSLAGSGATKGSLAGPVVAAFGVVLLVWFDWWSIGGNDDFAREEYAGAAQSIHRWTLALIAVWSVLVALLVLTKRSLRSRAGTPQRDSPRQRGESPAASAVRDTLDPKN